MWGKRLLVRVVAAFVAAVCVATAAQAICNENGLCEASERDAIAALHSQLDKDNDGVISGSESSRFLGKYVPNDHERKSKDKAFQKLDTSADDDNFVSVGELQQAWLSSKVRLWSEDDVAHWLEHKAKMPQYKQLFKDNDIGGKHLPMLALGKGRALMGLGIDERHAERLATLMMLEVLFPDAGTNYVKDIVLLVCLILLPVSAMGLWASNRGSKQLDQQLQRMREQLKQAEEQLNHTHTLANSKSLESMSSCAHDDSDNHSSPAVSRNTSVSLLDQMAANAPTSERERGLMAEVAQLKKALSLAESKAATDGADKTVRHLLRVTYQREVTYYSDKRRKAEISLREATEEYQRVAKQQKRFMGSFRLAHGVSMDALHESVTAALEPLNETKKDYEEMVARWEQIDEALHLKLGFEKRKRRAAATEKEKQ